MGKRINISQGNMNLKLSIEDYLFNGEKKFNIDKAKTTVDLFYKDKSDYSKLSDDYAKELDELQGKMYAHNRYGLLIIFQAMDAAGKDSTIKHVMRGVNTHGVNVYAFKRPSLNELEHDFMWRTNLNLPKRGSITIFNRSYYEEVLIVRVHPEILRAQQLPDAPPGKDAVWQERYRSIAGLERHLHANGTRIVKFFLHLSKEEQRKRFLDRIDDPEKNWKFSAADVEERGYWDDYMQVYEACLGATSTPESPWYVVPADDKLNAHLIISEVILDTLQRLRMTYPRSDRARMRELNAIRKHLLK